ncbi:MAG: helix-turn-helix domain-containing protein [Solirubrobacteraceae bacterium]
MQTAYLTIPEVAAELDISTDGVYKLIKRGKLPAIRRSERGMRVSRVAFDAYRLRLRNGVPPSGLILELNPQVDALHSEFERETGLSPEGWERRWKTGEIEDSAENMRLAIRALTLRLADQQMPSDRQSTVVKARKAVHSH